MSWLDCPIKMHDSELVSLDTCSQPSPSWICKTWRLHRPATDNIFRNPIQHESAPEYPSISLRVLHSWNILFRYGIIIKTTQNPCLRPKATASPSSRWNNVSATSFAGRQHGFTSPGKVWGVSIQISQYFNFNSNLPIGSSRLMSSPHKSLITQLNYHLMASNTWRYKKRHLQSSRKVIIHSSLIFWSASSAVG